MFLSQPFAGGAGAHATLVQSPTTLLSWGDLETLLGFQDLWGPEKPPLSHAALLG